MLRSSLPIRKSSRWLISVVFFSFILSLLAACGANGAPTTDDDQGGTAERDIQTVMGTVKVPAHPQRVVVLDTGELDAVVSLGVIPVGAVEAVQGGGFVGYLKDKLGETKNVGTIAQPNLTTISSLNPDLILSTKFRHADIYEQLSQIAPTVFAENVGFAWKDNFKLYANALNKNTEGEQVIQKYNNRLSELNQKAGGTLSNIHVSIVRVLSDRIRLYQNKSFIGVVLKDAGLARPANQTKDQTFTEYQTLENVQDFDGDVIFTTYYGNSQDKYNQLLSLPQFQQLQATRNNKVFPVSDDIWMLGIGYGAADLVINDLFKYLVK
jgi:iron complex transport system substrate-binding protein